MRGRKRVGPRASAQAAALGQHQTDRTGPPKEPCAKRQPGSSLHTIQRAGLPSAPPSITHKARSPKLRAHRGWLFDNHLPRQALSHSLILRSRRSLRLEGGSRALWILLRDGLLARPPQDEGWSGQETKRARRSADPGSGTPALSSRGCAAEPGIHNHRFCGAWHRQRLWIPACAGMTTERLTPASPPCR